MALLKLLLYALIALAVVSVLTFIASVLIQIRIERKKGHTRPKNGTPPKKRAFFKRICIDFPRRLVSDIYARQDYAFDISGLHLIVGEQGSGKTIALVYILMRLKLMYPKIKIRTNMCYKHEDGKIKNWRDLVFKNNGIYGEVDVIDEIQNWFNSLQSKDFPPEMFGEITQQRKQRKCIFGTSQVWQRVGKPIREQCAYVYKPVTFFGCLTFVRVYKPKVDDEGGLSALKFRKMFFFVQNDAIRDSFDTFHKIQVQSLAGYKNNAERANGDYFAPQSPP